MRVYLFFYATPSDRADIFPRNPDEVCGSVREAMEVFRLKATYSCAYPTSNATEKDGGSTGCIYLEDWRHDNDPDWWLSFGPRGGVKKERG